MQDPIYVVFDGGNSYWKLIMPRWSDDRKNFEQVIQHDILVDNDGNKFRKMQVRYRGQQGVGDPEWLRVISPDVGSKNGVDGYFVVGGSAVHEGAVQRKTGAAKYERDYMGVALVASLIQALPMGYNNLHLWVSFPPADVTYVEDLINSVIGKWDVEMVTGNTIKYHVRSVQVYDEPLGGYAKVTLDVNGKPTLEKLRKGSTLVLDIGGKISNVIRIGERNRPQYSSAKSIDMGIQDVENEFVDRLRQEHSVLRGIRSFNPALVRQAIMTGEYPYKGGVLQCADSVRYSTSAIANRLLRVYENDFDGGAEDANVLVTGGGGGVLYPLLHTALQHENTAMADKTEVMHLANPRGGALLVRAYVNAMDKRNKRGA